jgi:zinc D-Ala-D-Ala carboxypeptidase
MNQAQWNLYPNFSKREFDCKHTGENQMSHDFMFKLQQLRVIYARPMLITSGYRSPKHPIEARKSTVGTHAQGIACDIAVSGADAIRLISLAIDLGFNGIGVQQKGDGRFIHLDTRAIPAIWSY